MINKQTNKQTNSNTENNRKSDQLSTTRSDQRDVKLLCNRNYSILVIVAPSSQKLKRTKKNNYTVSNNREWNKLLWWCVWCVWAVCGLRAVLEVSAVKRWLTLCYQQKPNKTAAALLKNVIRDVARRRFLLTNTKHNSLLAIGNFMWSHKKGLRSPFECVHPQATDGGNRKQKPWVRQTK